MQNEKKVTTKLQQSYNKVTTKLQLCESMEKNILLCPVMIT